MHDLLIFSQFPTIPASLRNIPIKYNIPTRLWTSAFQILIDDLYNASLNSLLALEHLHDFLFYAYTTYTCLLEEFTPHPLRAAWLESLGDLARYQMCLPPMVIQTVGYRTDSFSNVPSPNANGNEDSLVGPEQDSMSYVLSDTSPSSVGLAAARLLDVEPEKERWRSIARHWYGAGLMITPWVGKLHHRLGLTSLTLEGEELICVYHFLKRYVYIWSVDMPSG